MTKKQNDIQAKPSVPSAGASPGALRAANRIMEKRYDPIFHTKTLAHIIDRETGVAELSELLEAVKAVMAQLDFSGQIDYLDASTYKRLEQARAKCELLEQVGRKP